MGRNLENGRQVDAGTGAQQPALELHEAVSSRQTAEIR
jgi:hypothetical protein